jgi:hypothetical protein
MRTGTVLWLVLPLFLSSTSRIGAQEPESQQPSPESSSSSPATAKTKQVWTNDNISRLRGTISGIGTASIGNQNGSFTIAFRPTSSGGVHENLDVQNSFGQFSIPISGQGK